MANKTYPMDSDKKIKLFYYIVIYACPVVFLSLALMCFGGKIWDIKIGEMSFELSATLFVVGGLFSLFVSLFLFFFIFRYPKYNYFLCSRNSKVFKNKMIGLLEVIPNKIKETLLLVEGSGKAMEAKRKVNDEINRHFEFCILKIKKYKKFYEADIENSKLEAIIYEQIGIFSNFLDDANSTDKELLREIKKLRFCIEERFVGEKAESYKGSGDYIFISYSHKNTKEVFNTIRQLQEAGYNVWFDEGITGGDDWMDHLAKKIDGCTQFIVFQSQAYIKSLHCNVELKRAISNKKQIVRLILEDGRFSEGIEMYLGVIQAIDCREGLENKSEEIINALKS